MPTSSEEFNESSLRSTLHSIDTDRTCTFSLSRHLALLQRRRATRSGKLALLSVLHHDQLAIVLREVR